MSQEENSNQKDSMVILHISDLHFGIADETNPNVSYIALRQEEMIESLINTISGIAEQDPQWKPDIIAVSGDIAWTGKPEEYDLYINKFVVPICKVLNIERDRIITCPGNHDIIRDNVYRVNRYEKGQRIPQIPDLTVNQIDRQAHFFQGYVDKLLDGNGKDLCKKYTFPEWPWATFVTLNSAWDCRDDKNNDDDKGKLRVGLPILEHILRNVPKGNSIITLFHHPHTAVEDYMLVDGKCRSQVCEWLHTSEVHREHDGERIFASYIEDKAFIILNGHIHRTRKPRKVGKAYQFIGGTIYSNDTLKYHCRLIKTDYRGRVTYQDLRHTLTDDDEDWERTRETEVDCIHDIVKEEQRRQKKEKAREKEEFIQTLITKCENSNSKEEYIRYLRELSNNVLDHTISPTDEFNHKKSMIAGENMELEEEHVLNLRKGDDR